jgi:hypothetical protein
MEAELIRKVNPDARGDQKLWKLSEPYVSDDVTCEYVLTSAVDGHGILETFVFPANEDGRVIDWGELEGSYQGDTNHDRAIKGFCEGHRSSGIIYNFPDDHEHSAMNPIMSFISDIVRPV